jgi:hypothetical protein
VAGCEREEEGEDWCCGNEPGRHRWCKADWLVYKHMLESECEVGRGSKSTDGSSRSSEVVVGKGWWAEEQRWWPHCVD